MTISPKAFLLSVPLIVFFVASTIWFLVLIQTLSFIAGFMAFAVIIFLVFWQGLLIFRKAGELNGLKSRRHVIVVSLVCSLGLSEIFWTASFLPFPFYILGGLFAAAFSAGFDIMKTYFGQRSGLFAEIEVINFKKTFYRDIVIFIIFAAVLIFISGWLPRYE